MPQASETPTSLEIQIKCDRASLKLIRRDLSQIYNVGSSVSKGDKSLVSDFRAMFTRAGTVHADYLTKFQACMSLAISEKQDGLFPTDEDLKQRSEINSIYYKIIEYHQTMSSSPVLEISNSSINQSLSRSRLPQISLPTFSGVISEWPKFKQLFESMVNSNPDIPTIEKFHYLSTSLMGDPKTLISPFTVNEDNYKVAWEALNDRYDNKRLLATSYVEKILYYPPHKGTSNLFSFQNFIREVVENVRALQNVKLQNETDFLWLTIALSKLDSDSRRKFECLSVNKEWPTFNDLVEFVQGRCKILQLSGCPSDGDLKPLRPTKAASRAQVLTTTVDSSSSPNKISLCSCKQRHHLYECPIFREKSLAQRRSFLKGKNVCFNCLRNGHLSSSCASTGRCRTCKRKHHTLLHGSPPDGNSFKANSAAPCKPLISSQPDGTDDQSPVSLSVTGPAHVLLGTAEVLIPDCEGVPQPVRLLIDCGSQFSLITSSCAKRLGLNWQATHHKPLGAGQAPLPLVKGKLSCLLRSRLRPDCNLSAEPLVVASITGDLPTAPISSSVIARYNNNELADPFFWKPRPIDFLLGSDLFMKTLCNHPLAGEDEYGALATVFGLILMGPSISSNSRQSVSHCLHLSDSPISDELISKFWEAEEIAVDPGLVPSHPCEKHFVQTHYREPNGRYVVSLPFKDEPGDLSASAHLARSRYRHVEGKFNRNPTLKSKYVEFMTEYEELGHMSPATEPSSYTIPHHAVFRPCDPEAKIRVVFDASMKTPNGSLNDVLLTGPKLQRDITDVILNFRRYALAVTADLVKMYRQVSLNPQQRRYQHIFWRSPAGDLRTYALNTVTYGTAPAAFLAIRTLHQLVQDEGSSFPRAAKALLDESYVDDILTGADTLQEAIALKTELIELLDKGCFPVHKWCSNEPAFMQAISSEDTRVALSFSPKEGCVRKVLGMSWNPSSDELFFIVRPVTVNTTKRGILSVIARLYDPIGFLSPVVFKAKCLLQEVWMSKTSWDEEVPHHLAQEWTTFSRQLPSLSSIRIPRKILFSSQRSCQILGFCDASQKGFAAALYVRAISSHEEVKISLIKAKTKLAPIKTISIPRLELSAAHLLVKLTLSIRHLVESLKISDHFYFTDSTIVLGWIKISPHLLQTYVANRVTFITSHTTCEQWFHVSSSENPADLASRGIFPEQLAEHVSWWAAPPRFKLDTFVEPTPPLQEVVPELRSGVTLSLNHSEPWLLSWIQNHSGFQKMLRILAYLLRFIHNTHHQGKAERLADELTPCEITSALHTCIKTVQQHFFGEEFSWQKGKPLSRRLLRLSAFLDDEGIIRVGGRLQCSDLPYSTKYPIVLPGKCHLVYLLIDHHHLVHYHLGVQALQAVLRRRYWIFQLRTIVRNRLNKCLPCYRMKTQPIPPQMGNLPRARIQPSHPFTTTGVDYAGPFSVKVGLRRNSPVSKAYLALFVCFSTKAVHLELVSSLSTTAFLAAFDRFVSRRRLPERIYSDCGRNFVGAARTLKELYSWLNDQQNQSIIQKHATSRGVHWHFNPPYTPHFGGIWEAAVKSAKHHLSRILGDHPLTFEELATILCRIEAIMNSRPLCPINEDTTHGDFLTPGHFLTGAPLTALPEPDITHLKLNRLSRWQMVQNAVQHFWKRWHTEYLHTLQTKSKWYNPRNAIAVGDLVLISDTSSSPLSWPMARVIQCHPGEDGIARVVSLQTRQGKQRRSVHRLVSLSHLTSDEQP